MDTTHIFAQRIKGLREERGLSQGKLADELGISRGALSYYESAQRTADISMLVKFTSYFGVTTDYLLGLSNNRTLESADIGKTTGLSDKAIDQIKVCKDSFFYRQGLNVLACEKSLLRLITMYLYGFAADGLSKSDYSDVPLKVYSLSNFSKISFAEVIEHLPRLRERIENQYKNNPDRMDALFLSFLSVYGDAERLRAEDGLYTQEDIDDGIYDIEHMDFHDYGYPSPDEELDMMKKEDAKWKFLQHIKNTELNH